MNNSTEVILGNNYKLVRVKDELPYEIWNLNDKVKGENRTYYWEIRGKYKYVREALEQLRYLNIHEGAI